MPSLPRREAPAQIGRLVDSAVTAISTSSWHAAAADGSQRLPNPGFRPSQRAGIDQAAHRSSKPAEQVASSSYPPNLVPIDSGALAQERAHPEWDAAGNEQSSAQLRLSPRSPFDSPNFQSQPGSQATIIRPLTPTGTHLVAAGPASGRRVDFGAEEGSSEYPPPFISHGSGVTVQRPPPREMPPRSTLKRDRSEDSAQAPPSSAKRNPGGTETIKTDQPKDEGSGIPDFHSEKTSILRDRQLDAFNDGQHGLPAEKGFPIQIGSELFRLSGASIMSDAPSYFSRFFHDQLRQPDNDGGVVKTLYIDRDPATFQDIALHLQGYYIKPRDGNHFVRLFSDAQFYSLPKLIKQLFESDICIRIGDRDFVIPRDLFTSPGNSPNYFTLGFAIFATSPGEVFPGLERENLFRPPSIDPPALLNRSPEIFADLLHTLRGYPLKIRSAEHRAALLRDCRYYHLRGLEQALLPHSSGFNLARSRPEIAMRLEDIRQSGLSFGSDGDVRSPTPSSYTSALGSSSGYVQYARPFVDDTPAELILELGASSARLDPLTGGLQFTGTARARVTSLLHVVATKMNLPNTTPLGLMMRATSNSGTNPNPNTAPNVSLNSGPSSNNGAGTGTGTGGVSDSDGSAPGPSSTPLADDDRVKATLSSDAHVVLDGLDRAGLRIPNDGPEAGDLASDDNWLLDRSQWRLRIRPREEGGGLDMMEVVFEAVKVLGVTGERGRNVERGWVND